MKKVTKEKFEEFIKNYDGSGELYSHNIKFTTPNSTIYCDFGLHPEMQPGLERISACLVAEHVYPDDIDGRPLLIRDDLCDGGGTFLGLAKAIREIKPDAKISIFVDHMVNPRGIENLSKTFDHVQFTNSYKDWKKDWEGQPTSFPKNVTQIDVV